jgi:hypothetical protein
LWTSLFCIKDCTPEATNNSKVELCAATLLAKLYKKVTCALNITINESYLWTDSSIVLTWIQGPPNKWKTFVDNSRHHPRRNSFSHIGACANSIQSCWSHFKRNWSCNTFKIYTMVEGTTMAFTGATQLACNRGQCPHRKLRSQEDKCCAATTSRGPHKKILQVDQTHQSHRILQKIH